MNGKEYLHTFEGHAYGAPIEGELGLADSYSALLTDKLHLLYGIGEIAFLGDSVKPQAVVESELSVADSRMVASAGVVMRQNHRRNRQRNGHSLVPDKLSFPVRPVPETSDMSAAAREIAKDCETLQANLTRHGDLVLSHALINMQRMSSRTGEPQEGQARESVRLAIRSQRKDLFEVIEPWRGRVSFSRDILNGRQVDFSVHVDRMHKHVPEWMREIDEWHVPIHRLAAALTETEALIVAQEWTTRRGLSYIPVIAPKHLEGGAVNRHVGKNPHADLLLCNIEPGKNEIIPIQIKNTASPDKMRRYIDGMNFMTPQSLGLVSSKTHPIRQSGGFVRTGHRVTVEHGNILENYYQCYGMRRNKPSRAACDELEALLQPGFEYLDRLIAA